MDKKQRNDDHGKLLARSEYLLIHQYYTTMKKKLLTIVMLLLIGISQGQSFKFAVICDTRSNAGDNGKDGVNVAAVKGICHNLIESGLLWSRPTSWIATTPSCTPSATRPTPNGSG